jgi:hypothetical protein
MQLAPTDNATTSPSSQPRTWKSVVEAAISISSSQNGGEPRLGRSCQPEFKICTTAIFFVDKDRKEMMIKATENLTGQQIRREICTFNDFKDVRMCLDFDDGTTRRDMKNSSGDWYKVADE